MERHWQLKVWALVGAFIGLAIGLAVVLVAALDAARSIEDWNQEYATWHASQIEVEFWRLLDTGTAFVSGVTGVEQADLALRIDLLFSRLGIFDGGLSRQRLERVAGAAEVVRGLKAALELEEAPLRSLRPGDVEAFQDIRSRLLPIEPLVRNLVVSFEFYETDGAVAAVQRLHGLFILAAVLIVGVLIAGVALVVFLLFEIRVRRRLLESVLASREQARAAREREEAALVEAGRRFRAIATANPVALLVLDAGGGAIRYANPAAVALLGLPEGEREPAQARDFFPDPVEFATVVKTCARGALDHFDARLRRHDGREVPVSLSARPLVYDDADCVVVGALDQTEKVAAEIEIERQREIIYHNEKLGALGSLLAGVAHELNNPLSIVVAQAALLEEAATDPRTASRGARIRAAAERCARIVRTFLALARQHPPSRNAVDVNHAVAAAMELLGYGLRSTGVEVATSLESDLPAIWADADQLSQVITNLVLNAQQAMAEWPGPRRLAIVTRFDPVRDQVVLVVADSGPGVPAEIRSRIFEPFFTTKPVGIGTGIGLSVSHSAVASHGGTIEVREAAGGGAEFIVRLPVGAANPAPHP